MRILDSIQNDEMISREQLAVLQTHIINGISFDSVIEDIKTEIAKIEIPEDVKTVDGSFAFCQALEIADIAIDRVMSKHISGKEN